jgi:hypothetical protein
MHLNSFLLFKKYAPNYVSPDHKILEIGVTDKSPYYSVLDHDNKLWYTMDLFSFNPGYHLNHFNLYHEYTFPIESETFDVVIKPGGICITINPVSWPYHLAPVDCWRIYPDGMKALSASTGFAVLLSTFETLELDYCNIKPYYQHISGFFIPGVSMVDHNWKMHSINRFRYRLNRVMLKTPFLSKYIYPISVAYDTITIAMKNF